MKAMPISKIRETIRSLNWARMEFTGGTREENKRTNLPEILAPYIEAVKGLEIKPRFARDIEDQKQALEFAERVIERWHVNQKILIFHPAA